MASMGLITPSRNALLFFAKTGTLSDMSGRCCKDTTFWSHPEVLLDPTPYSIVCGFWSLQVVWEWHPPPWIPRANYMLNTNSQSGLWVAVPQSGIDTTWRLAKI